MRAPNLYKGAVNLPSMNPAMFGDTAAIAAAVTAGIAPMPKPSPLNMQSNFAVAARRRRNPYRLMDAQASASPMLAGLGDDQADAQAVEDAWNAAVNNGGVTTTSAPNTAGGSDGGFNWGGFGSGVLDFFRTVTPVVRDEINRRRNNGGGGNAGGGGGLQPGYYNPDGTFRPGAQYPTGYPQGYRPEESKIDTNTLLIGGGLLLATLFVVMTPAKGK